MSTTVLIVVPAGCFVVFVYLLAWALCVAAAQVDAEDRERELRASRLDPPLWADVQLHDWPKRDARS